MKNKNIQPAGQIELEKEKIYITDNLYYSIFSSMQRELGVNNVT